MPESHEGEANVHVPTPGNPFRLADMQPLRDRILVQPLAMSSRVAGGLLHAPEQSHQREKPQTGLVVSIGPGIRSLYTGELVPMVNRPGDVVFYGKYSGQQFNLGDQDYLNMAEIEVFARLPGGTFTLVEHEKARDWHLLGDYCDQCASPEEKAAKEALQKDREAMVAASRLRERPGMPPDLSIADARDVADYGTPADEEQPAPAPERDPAAARSALDEERERMRQLRRAAEKADETAAGTVTDVVSEVQ